MQPVISLDTLDTLATRWQKKEETILPSPVPFPPLFLHSPAPLPNSTLSRQRAKPASCCRGMNPHSRRWRPAAGRRESRRERGGAVVFGGAQQLICLRCSMEADVACVKHACLATSAAVARPRASVGLPWGLRGAGCALSQKAELPLLWLFFIFLPPETSFLQHGLQLCSPDCIFSHRKEKPAPKAESTFNTLNIAAYARQEKHRISKPTA